MPLSIPNLDDRRFQDIVDEAKRMIPRYCPEWTDHNVSDPGVTLIELFAWMTEMLIFRLNQVPDKSYITFMDLMGVKLQPPAAARALLTFWLSAPTIDLVRVPANTEVSTVQTAAERAINFATDNELVIYPPTLTACLTSLDERTFEDQTWRLSAENERFLAFSATPQPGNAFYLAFNEDLSNNILDLTIDCTIEGIGVDPINPPLSWEIWGIDGWMEVELERDETGGLNKRGRVVLYLPPRLIRRAISEHQGYWLRCRHTPPEPNQPTYSASPRIETISAATIGGMVAAINAITVQHDLLGRSNGKPGQLFRIERLPMLRRRAGETVEIENEQGAWEPWTECEHFGDSGPDDKHFCVDSVSGEVSFGPAIREPDGSERQYGAVPPRTQRIRFSRYRYGGGASGNVGAGTLTLLRSTISYVDRVTNRARAVGGRDAETLDRARLRAPQTLRSSFRAVTTDDFEYLSREASPNVARARCLQPRALNTGGLPPGTVQMLLIPAVPQPEGRLQPEQLQLPRDVVRDVQDYLDERRLLTSTVRIADPTYLFVKVVAQVRAQPGANLELVRHEILTRLYRFLNPLVGGSDGKGWPFERDMYISEIYTTLQGTPGLAYIEQASLLLDGTSEPQARIALPLDGMIASGEHEITVI